MAVKVQESYSLIVGGPFWRLQRRLGLLGPDRLPTVKTAVLFAAVAWLPPALLALLQGVALSETLGGRAFLLDFGAYARFIIAIMMFVVTERFADELGAVLLRQVTDAGLVPPEEQAGFKAALQRADQRTRFARGEALMLCISFAVSVASLFSSRARNSGIPGSARWSTEGYASLRQAGGQCWSACRCSGFLRCAGYGVSSS